MCKICEDVDDLYKWQTFRPSGLHPRGKSGTDEGHWAEMFAIYINYRHIRGFYTKKYYRGNACLDYIISSENFITLQTAISYKYALAFFAGLTGDHVDQVLSEINNLHVTSTCAHLVASKLIAACNTSVQ